MPTKERTDRISAALEIAADKFEIMLDLTYVIYEDYICKKEIPDFDNWTSINRLTKAQLSLLEEIRNMFIALRGEEA